MISCKWLDKIKSTDMAYLCGKKQLIAELAEAIIPETDTPGAKQVKVEEFIIRMLTDCADSRSLNNFIIGLQELEEYSYLNYRRPFTACSAIQQEEILRAFERKASPYKGLLGKVERKLLGRPFFSLLKAYTVMGFCTSQLGATRALRYEGIPGGYENVGPMASPQRSWATK